MQINPPAFGIRCLGGLLRTTGGQTQGNPIPVFTRHLLDQRRPGQAQLPPAGIQPGFIHRLPSGSCHLIGHLEFGFAPRAMQIDGQRPAFPSLTLQTLQLPGDLLQLRLQSTLLLIEFDPRQADGAHPFAQRGHPCLPLAGWQWFSLLTRFAGGLRQGLQEGLLSRQGLSLGLQARLLILQALLPLKPLLRLGLHQLAGLNMADLDGANL